MCRTQFPLEPLVQGRKHETAQVGGTIYLEHITDQQSGERPVENVI